MLSQHCLAGIWAGPIPEAAGITLKLWFHGCPFFFSWSHYHRLPSIKLTPEIHWVLKSSFSCTFCWMLKDLKFSSSSKSGFCVNWSCQKLKEFKIPLQLHGLWFHDNYAFRFSLTDVSTLPKYPENALSCKGECQDSSINISRNISYMQDFQRAINRRQILKAVKPETKFSFFSHSLNLCLNWKTSLSGNDHETDIHCVLCCRN